MARIPEYKSIFSYILSALDNDELSRRELIDKVISYFSLSAEEIADNSITSTYSTLRSSCGVVINDMTSKGIITLDENQRYKRVEDQIIAVRIEDCEEEILKLVSLHPMTKGQLKDSLISYFGTDKTPSVKDDNRLFTFTGQILKSLVADGIFNYDGSHYSIAPEKTAYIKDRAELLSLRADFISRIHSRGGEFFEIYFINLLKRYFIRMGKTVLEASVTGGSNDGGIDGIVKTRDSLGFVETIMIQTKNRNEIINETTLRGFYGAVVAKSGTRGIFATISDFHPMAKAFLDSIDDCVGVNGEKLFSMATDTSYGIIREGGRLKIDKEII